MMEKYEMRRQIGPSICDASGKLSHAEAFGLFMDIASFHAEQIGVGLGAMAQKDLFWLTVKTQVNFIRRSCVLTMGQRRRSLLPGSRTILKE